MKSLTRSLRLAAVAGVAGVVGIVGAAGPAHSLGTNNIVTAITGTVSSTASSPLCVTGSVATFSGAALTGTFNAGTAVFAGTVSLNGSVTATADSCADFNVVTNGHLNGPVPISNGLGVGTLSGQLNAGGTYQQIGNVAIAHISVTYGINGGAQVTVPATAVVTATPIPPSFSTSVVAGAVVG